MKKRVFIVLAIFIWGFAAAQSWLGFGYWYINSTYNGYQYASNYELFGEEAEIYLGCDEEYTQRERVSDTLNDWSQVNVGIDLGSFDSIRDTDITVYYSFDSEPKKKILSDIRVGKFTTFRSIDGVWTQIKAGFTATLNLNQIESKTFTTEALSSKFYYIHLVKRYQIVKVLRFKVSSLENVLQTIGCI